MKSITRPDSLIVTAITCLYVIWLLLMPVAPGYPYDDDFAVHQSARHLVATGDLVISDWMAPTLITQVLWSSLFCAISDCGFAPILLGQVILSWIVLLAFYFLARRLGIAPARALLITLCLLITPLYLRLSYSAMTDMMGLACTFLALHGYLGANPTPSPLPLQGEGIKGWGLKLAGTHFLVIGSLFAALGYLTRQMGILVVIGAAGWAILTPGTVRQKAARLIAVLAIPLLVVIGYQVWFNSLARQPWAARMETAELRAHLTSFSGEGLIGEFPRNTIIVGLQLAFMTLPLLLIILGSLILDQRRLRATLSRNSLIAALVIGIICLLWALRQEAQYPYSGAMLSSSYYALVKPSIIPLSAAFFVGVLLVGYIRSLPTLRRDPRWLMVGLAFSAILLATICFHKLIDRYLLLAIPGALLMIGAWLPEMKVPPILAAGVLLIFGGVAFLAIRNEHFRDQAIQQAGDYLREEVGAAPEEVSLRFPWNFFYSMEPDAITRAGLPPEQEALLAWLGWEPVGASPFITQEKYLISLDFAPITPPADSDLIHTLPYRCGVWNRCQLRIYAIPAAP